MSNLRNFLFLTIAFFFTIGWTNPSLSDSSKRKVSLELEAVDGATQYEIELTSKRNNKRQNFKMKDPLWKASVRPGEYSLRMRAYDKRKVPGPWSESLPFLVKLPNAQLLSPIDLASVKADDDKSYSVEMKWAPVPDAKKYILKVTDLDSKEEFKDSFSSSEGSLRLPVAKKYSWSVTSVDKNGNESEPNEEPFQFTLIGAPIKTPEITPPEDIWVQQIRWSTPEYARNFSYLLQKKSSSGGWEKILVKTAEPSSELPFSIDYPGGLYRLGVKAEGELRAPSKMSVIEFEVFSGDRSPAAVEESKLRYSLEKPTPWYFIASYLITQITYSGSNPEAGSGRRIVYNATGGTGRLGLGYIHPKKNAGFLGLMDLSGFTVDGANVTYPSLELHYVKKYNWGRNLFRPSAGLFYKELVETFDKPSSFITGQFEQRSVSYHGPHIGFDLWRPFTAKLGLQANLRLYSNALGGDTPSGKDIDPEISYQIGLMGSYKLNKNITGFAGWARRIDRVSYESKLPGEAPFINSNPGDRQQIEISGDYLNFLLEWAF